MRICLLCCVALLPACTPQQPQAAASAIPASTARNAPEAAPRCPREPQLGHSQAFQADATGVFDAGTPAFAELQSRFHQAYAQACESGWLAHSPLLDPAAAPPLVLMLANAPEANIASVYLDAGDDMLLEYRFVDAAGRAHVPGTDELREAIYCRVVGASEAEEESNGRCLPD